MVKQHRLGAKVGPTGLDRHQPTLWAAWICVCYIAGTDPSSPCGPGMGIWMWPGEGDGVWMHPHSIALPGPNRSPPAPFHPLPTVAAPTELGSHRSSAPGAYANAHHQCRCLHQHCFTEHTQQCLVGTRGLCWPWIGGGRRLDCIVI